MNQPKVFLSYARENAIEVEELYQDLVEAGVRPWLDTKDLLPGQDWDLAIATAIRDADAVVVCLSTASVEKEGYLQEEIERARQRWTDMRSDEIFVIPVRLDTSEIPETLARFQAVDLWNRRGFIRLLKAIDTARASRATQVDGAANSQVTAALPIGLAPKFFYYISKSKVEMLLPQLRRDHTAERSAFGVVADCLSVIGALQQQQLLSPFDENSAVTPATFYSTTGVWRSGLFYFRTMVSTTVAYFVWKRFGTALVVLTGSPDNIIGRRVARDGVLISSTGDAIDSIGGAEILTVINTDEIPSVVLGGRRGSDAIPPAGKKVHVVPAHGETRERGDWYRPQVHTHIPHIALSVFCLRELANLPEMNVETVFRMYSQSTAQNGNFLEDLRAEYAERRKEYPRLYTDDGLAAARAVGLGGIHTVYLGSPVYVAIA